MTSKLDCYCICDNCGWNGPGREADTTYDDKYCICPYCGSGGVANLSHHDMIQMRVYAQANTVHFTIGTFI